MYVHRCRWVWVGWQCYSLVFLLSFGFLGWGFLLLPRRRRGLDYSRQITLRHLERKDNIESWFNIGSAVRTLTCRATQIMRMMGDQKKQRQR